MRSRGEPPLLERVSRGVALAALGALLWLAWRPRESAGGRVDVRGTAALPAQLVQATRASVPGLDVTLDSVPGRRDREWLRAIAGAGTAVTWRHADGDPSADRGRALAITAEPMVEPSRRMRLVVMAPAGASVAVTDRAGSVDSVVVTASGARVLDATVDGVVEGSVNGDGARGIATTVRRDSVVLRPVLVLANAGWEGKFVVAALEEDGWQVHARFAVAPRLAVVQEGEGPGQRVASTAIDTATYAAVVALDDGAAPFSAAITRYVRQGGGLVVGRGATSLPAFAPILPARPGASVTPVLGAIAGDEPLSALGGVALTALRRDALALDRTGGGVRIAAARVGVGRVVMSGYDDSWRWRMEGGEGAPAAHRKWWSSMVASVAYAPVASLIPLDAQSPDSTTDETPYAGLVAALGQPATGAVPSSAPVSRTSWQRILFALLIGSLLVEWGSRRLRGVR